MNSQQIADRLRFITEQQAMMVGGDIGGGLKEYRAKHRNLTPAQARAHYARLLPKTKALYRKNRVSSSRKPKRKQGMWNKFVKAHFDEVYNSNQIPLVLSPAERRKETLHVLGEMYESQKLGNESGKSVNATLSKLEKDVKNEVKQLETQLVVAEVNGNVQAAQQLEEELNKREVVLENIQEKKEE